MICTTRIVIQTLHSLRAARLALILGHLFKVPKPSHLQNLGTISTKFNYGISLAFGPVKFCT